MKKSETINLANMITIFRDTYVLLLSYNPCNIFTYYNVDEMNGLNLKDCTNHQNTTESAYIAGWSNFVPNQDNDRRYVFINLSRCTDTIHIFGLIIHEMMHHSMWMHNYNLHKEEEIITWAEEEAYQVYKLIKQHE